MKKNKETVTKKMTMLEIIDACPEAADIMYNYGLHCIGCHVSSFETLEEGAKVHGLSKRDIDEMVKEMNGAKSHRKSTKKKDIAPSKRHKRK